MGNLILIIQKVQKIQPAITNLRESAHFAWKNLNPGNFSVGKVWLGGWKMGGYGTAYDWYKYKNCLPSLRTI